MKKLVEVRLGVVNSDDSLPLGFNGKSSGDFSVISDNSVKIS